MINCIKRPNSFLNKDFNWYLNELKKFNPEFIINIKSLQKIFKIIKSNSLYSDDIFKNILFLVYNMHLTNDIENPLDYKFGGTPKDGFEFINKKTFEGLGVYHAHVSQIDLGVLIWYITWDDYGYMINFDYIIHPKCNEKTYITKLWGIYQIENSYHHTKKDYLCNLYKLLNENVILKYIEWLNE